MNWRRSSINNESWPVFVGLDGVEHGVNTVSSNYTHHIIDGEVRQCSDEVQVLPTETHVVWVHW